MDQDMPKYIFITRHLGIFDTWEIDASKLNDNEIIEWMKIVERKTMPTFSYLKGDEKKEQVQSYKNKYDYITNELLINKRHVSRNIVFPMYRLDRKMGKYRIVKRKK